MTSVEGARVEGHVEGRRRGATRLAGPVGVRANGRLARRLLVDPIPVLDECAAAYGPTFALRLGPARLVVVGDPDDLSTVFAQPSVSYRWGHLANVLGFIVGPTSMIVSDGEDHRRRRAASQPGLARRRLDRWIPMIVGQVDRAIDQHLAPALDAGRVVDVHPLGTDLVLAVTVRAFFGNGLEHRTAEIGALFDELQSYLERPGLQQLPHRLPFTARARARAARAAFNGIVDREVARRRAAVGAGPDGDDLLDVFVDEAASGLTAEEVHDQVTTLIGAGYNTTAATLAWAVHRSLATPGVWDRLRAEAHEVLGPVGDGPTLGAEAHRDLSYAAAVAQETLRLHPPGALSPRQAVIDVPVGDRVIPRRAMVAWSPHLAGRHPGAWDEPLAFRPERHLDPTPEQAARMEAAWVPFGRGPRRCIGFALAQMELALVLARLAQRVDMELVDPAPPRPHGMVVNRPAGGVRVRRPLALTGDVIPSIDGLRRRTPG